MISLTINNIPDRVLEQLRLRAAQHQRSISSEALHLLERSLEIDHIDAEEILNRIDRLHRRAALPRLTDEVLERAKNEGRP